MVFHLAGDPAMVPFAGTYQGLSEVERFFDRLFSIVEAPADHDYKACYRYLAQGKDVIIWGHSWLHPIGAPLELPTQVTHRVSFRKGKMVLFDGVYDTLHAARLLNPPPTLLRFGAGTA